MTVYIITFINLTLIIFGSPSSVFAMNMALVADMVLNFQHSLTPSSV